MLENQIIETEELSIEEQYGGMSQIEHVLERPGMYIGSLNAEIVPFQLYKPSTNKIITVKEVSYVAGINKLVDEVITNSVDEFRKQKEKFGINEVWVDVNTNGTVIVRDNGGIPVVEHKTYKMLLPKFILGTLMSSGNYGKKVQRKGAGLNGLGAKLTNIFSKYFNVITCDGQNMANIQWSNNMRTVDHERVGKSKEHFTEITFELELFRFGIEELPLDTIRIIQKRCIDASTNIGLTMNFTSNVGGGLLNGSWNFQKFSDFVNLHIEDERQLITQKKGGTTIIVTQDVGYNYGFVNGAVCKQGTHITYIQKQIAEKLLDVLKKKHDITLITAKDVFDKISLFVDVSIFNPEYDSQTKEKLTNKFDKDTNMVLSKEFLTSLETSDILNELVDFYNIKYLEQEKKTTKELNKKIRGTKSTKLQNCANKDKNNELWLFEGTSPANGFSKARNPNFQACYELRGKFKNIIGKSREEIMKNREIVEIISACELQFDNPKQNLKNCPFKYIIFGTDADYDGTHIQGLLLAFFCTFFPELIEDGRLYGLISPIVIAQKDKKEDVMFYTIEEFEKEKHKYKGYDFEYIKGLGSLENKHYKPLVRDKRLVQFLADELYMESIKNWFDGEYADVRKELMLSDLSDVEEVE